MKPCPISIGDRNGGLLAIEHLGVENGHRRWLCECDCGCRVTVLTENFGRTKSCGCLRRQMGAEKNLKHGHARTKKQTLEFKSWSNMLRRCYDPNNNRFAIYGARGITVCDRWRESFANFFADMGHRPSPRHSIDRRDTNGNYEPGNCRWATDGEQANNRRKRNG